MKNILFSIVLIPLSFSALAQEVISSQGDSYSNASAAIDFTIGEVVINTGTSGSTILTQGFHQTNWNFVGLEDHFPGYEVSLYPNPLSDLLNIKIQNFKDVSYSLIDIQGKIVLQDNLNSELTSIGVDHLAPGSYSLVLSNQENKLKTYRIIKTK